MAVVNGPAGVTIERTEGMLYSSSAYSRGDVITVLDRNQSTYNASTEPTGGYPGWTRAYVQNATRCNNPAMIYAVCLEDVTAGSWFRALFRGTCEALVEKDATTITVGDGLGCLWGASTSEITDTGAMTLAADINAGGTVEHLTQMVKIIATAAAANDSTTAALTKVNFNGIEGFGIIVGSHVA